MSLEVIAQTGNENLATVYIGQFSDGRMVEFVESVQPPYSLSEKWVLIVSTLCGCPVECVFCDAGGNFKGLLSKEEIFQQIDYMVMKRFPSKKIPVKKFKIQFARVGEPSFNPAIIDVLDEIKSRYDADGFLPSISTIAPEGSQIFFNNLYEIKEKKYKGNFQLQFSIHTTDEKLRNEIIPIRKWDFKKISEYSENFKKPEDKKITLNFALAKNYPLDTNVLLENFNPEIFLIKITPVNPTNKSIKNNIESQIKEGTDNYKIIDEIKKSGYEVILSTGEYEENKIGSNCGMYISNMNKEQTENNKSYTYILKEN
jgi:23S rRNA (adenine2503-C2)-methyltransferase